jgi:ribosomal protein S18 acetylase RimI-like enzyme
MIFCDTSDAKELSEMAWDIWIDYYSTFVTGDNIEYILSISQTEEAIRQQILDGYLYSFIFEEGVKVGYLCFLPKDDLLYISKYYVFKEFRGKGIGSRAMDEILEIGRAMNMKTAYLNVNRHNLRSIEIYKHKGFIIAKEDKKDIGNGFYMDDYRMEYYF